ncbi:MAG: sulfurtransferase TusA family protein [Gammaproteobacteria bacterium]|nr:sulfurtransferase TusA family protein [Gammaproteobacteria bacterium]
MWPFKRNNRRPEISANSVTMTGGEVVVDVRGQTCPGYLLAINKAVDALPAGAAVRLLITYPPCGEDVQHWSNARGYEFLGVAPENGLWIVRIRK